MPASGRRFGQKCECFLDLYSGIEYVWSFTKTALSTAYSSRLDTGADWHLLVLTQAHHLCVELLGWVCPLHMSCVFLWERGNT